MCMYVSEGICVCMSPVEVEHLDNETPVALLSLPQCLRHIFIFHVLSFTHLCFSYSYTLLSYIYAHRYEYKLK